MSRSPYLDAVENHRLHHHNASFLPSGMSNGDRLRAIAIIAALEVPSDDTERLVDMVGPLVAVGEGIASMATAMGADPWQTLIFGQGLEDLASWLYALATLAWELTTTGDAIVSVLDLEGSDG